jgi:hypothetical protein
MTWLLSDLGGCQFRCIFLLLCTGTHALTSSDASLTRSRLAEALSSPSGKLTLSAELVIPEPASPTAILLQASQVKQLSETIRTKAKANCAFVSCAPTSLTSSIKTICNEQEEARGNFPAPLPVIYCAPQKDDGDSDDDSLLDLSALAEAGASGLLVTIPNVLNSVEDITTDEEWVIICQQALENGLQPIPEVIVQDSAAAGWVESDMENLVDKLADAMAQDPVSILVTIQSSKADDGTEEAGGDEDEAVPLPKIARSLGRRVPLIGSIRTSAGGGRLGGEIARLKAAGFTGALLRQECIPGHEKNPSLEYVSDFWAACIGDLKSTRSKTFNFRSRNLMEKSVPLEWAKYQKSVIESGALGEAEDAGPPSGFNPDAGDYKGF